MALFLGVSEGVGFAVELGIWCLIIGLLVIRFGYQHTIGLALHELAHLFDSIGFHFSALGQTIGFDLSGLGNAVLALDNSIMAGLGAAIGANQYAAHKVWQWTAYIAEQSTRVVADLAEATYGALAYMRRFTVPALIAAFVSEALKGLHWTTQQITHITTHPVEIITKTITAATPALNSLRSQVAELEADVAAIDVPALVHAPPLTVPRVGDITKGFGQVWPDVRRIFRVLTPAGILGLVAAASLSTLGLGWLKCRGVNRAGHALCGLSGLIETLLGDALDALVVADLCQFTEALAYAARKFEPVLIGFVDVEDALIGCGGSSRPAMPSVGTLSLPPVTGFVLS